MRLLDSIRTIPRTSIWQYNESSSRKKVNLWQQYYLSLFTEEKKMYSPTTAGINLEAIVYKKRRREAQTWTDSYCLSWREQAWRATQFNYKPNRFKGRPKLSEKNFFLSGLKRLCWAPWPKNGLKSEYFCQNYQFLTILGPFLEVSFSCNFTWYQCISLQYLLSTNKPMKTSKNFKYTNNRQFCYFFICIFWGSNADFYIFHSKLKSFLDIQSLENADFLYRSQALWVNYIFGLCFWS